MRKPLIILIIITSSCKIHSQSLALQLSGFWVSKPIVKDTALISNSMPVIKQSIRFFRSKYFERAFYFSDSLNGKIDSAMYWGKYKLDSKEKRMSMEVTRVKKNTNFALLADQYKSTIIFNSDSSFSLSGNIYYKTPSLYNYNTFSKVYYLVNRRDTSKKVEIWGNYVSLLVNAPLPDTSCLIHSNELSCSLDSIKNDSLICQVGTENITLQFRNRFTRIENVYYSSKKEVRTFSLEQVQSINFKTPHRQLMTTIGGTILYISCITFIATPLAGLSLRGEARQNARRTVLLTSAAGMVISIPFFTLGKNKTYGISNSYATRLSNYWMLKEKYD